MSEVTPRPTANLSAVPNPAPAAPDAGWYDDGTGRQRWFDGTQWTEMYQSAPASAPAPQQPIQVTVAAPVQSDVRKARDKAQYVRQQKGHSIILHLLLGMLCLWINVIYISVSPNHYWHA